MAAVEQFIPKLLNYVHSLFNVGIPLWLKVINKQLPPNAQLSYALTDDSSQTWIFGGVGGFGQRVSAEVVSRR